MSDYVIVHFNDLPDLIRDYPKAAAMGIEATAREGERYVKQSISDSPATGITYGNHIASSEGNPPRIDTSNLVNNINSREIRSFLWVIRSGAEYSAGLEYGTRFMAARPFMGPMAIWLEQQMPDIVAEFLRDVT